MNDRANLGSTPDALSAMDFQKLYDEHADYAARRVEGSFEQQQIILEVEEFKIPNLLQLLPDSWLPSSVLEIGCATGELIARFPVAEGGRRTGVDISPSNIAVGRARYADVAFYEGDFRELRGERFDVVIMSDVLEHVNDDVGFLRDASELAKYVLVNLPLEDNWLNKRREYGPNDVSGHLRKYCLDQGLGLFESAGLNVLGYFQVWVHETELDRKRRRLRRRLLGQAHAGSRSTQLAKAVSISMLRAIGPIGRHVFASNLFALAHGRSVL